jgi:hypothetical protein
VLDLLHIMEAKSNALAGPAAERARAKLLAAVEREGAR